MINRIYSLTEFPLFVKAGAIIPVQSKKYIKNSIDKRLGKNHVTILLYPNGVSCRTLHLPCGDGTEYEDYLISYDDIKGRLNVYGKDNKSFTFVLRGINSVVKEVKNASSWEFDRKIRN